MNDELSLSPLMSAMFWSTDDVDGTMMVIKAKRH
jgi:hypothetical protein